MAILKALHGSTGFWGLTHPVHHGIVHESVGERQPSPKAEARANWFPPTKKEMKFQLLTTRALRDQVMQEAQGEVRDEISLWNS